MVYASNTRHIFRPMTSVVGNSWAPVFSHYSSTKSFTLRIRLRILPVFRHHDSRFNTGILFQQIQEIAPTEQLKRLPISKFKGCLAVPAGCHQYPFRCTFVLYHAKEVTNGTYTNSMLVPFGLNDHYPTENRTGIEGNTVHSIITRCLSESRFQAHLLEQIRNQRLELRGSKIHEIGTLI